MDINIQNTIDDLVGNFLYYGRKEDVELPQGEIEKQLKNGKLTVDAIVGRFKQQLIEGTKND
ncbi:MAG: hypothetical protein V3U54_08645 [Thermodesulfobacteriota bacterium]